LRKFATKPPFLKSLGLTLVRETESKPALLFERVAILGVGLIGGSIAAAILKRGLAKSVVGYSPFDGEEAFRLGLLTNLAAHAEQAVEGADLVVVAVPPTAVANVIAQAMPSLGRHAIVTDVSSVKAQVVPQIARVMGERFSQYVSSHPIAGAEHSGPAAANAELFERKRIVLNPGSNAQTIEKIKSFWQALGGEVCEMTIAQHDEVYAAVSHLPHLVAFALCLGLSAREDARELIAHGGAGLRDTSRVGGSSASLWADILLSNRHALASTSAEFSTAWESINAAVSSNDKTKLLALLEQASAWRRAMR
jgi:cyclohexadieny/prephenate dehydrogenase / 3-phosphoshikimate 1-carboxyvinyltransferase